MSFFWKKEGIHLPSPIVPITCIKTPFSPVVFLGSYNFSDVVFYIICHGVLYQFLCIAHVWWVTIKIYLLTYLNLISVIACSNMWFGLLLTIHYFHSVRLWKQVRPVWSPIFWQDSVYDSTPLEKKALQQILFDQTLLVFTEATNWKNAQKHVQNTNINLCTIISASLHIALHYLAATHGPDIVCRRLLVQTYKPVTNKTTALCFLSQIMHISTPCDSLPPRILPPAVPLQTVAASCYDAVDRSMSSCGLRWSTLQSVAC